jgi:hypothetical protein
MYVVSVAGPKMYNLNETRWADRVASEAQLYQQISFSSDSVKYEAFTVDGKLYDAFSLIKNDDGINRFVEHPEIGNIQEQVILSEE